MKIIIVDDHPLVIKGLKMVLRDCHGLEIAGQATNSKETYELVETVKPDLMIVDLRLGKENGLDLIEKVRGIKTDCKFIVLTSSSSKSDFKKATELCVDGYISKEALPEEVMAAITMIKNGRKYYDPEMVQMIFCHKDDDAVHDLTAREFEVLLCLGKGMNNREIALNLYITEHTVKKHVSNILDKLVLTDRTQAALFAAKHCS